MRGAIRLALAVLATLAGLIVAWQLRAVLITFILSLAVAAAFRPAIDALTRRGVARPVALLVAYGLVIAGLGALLALAGGPLVTEVRAVVGAAGTLYMRIRDEWPHGTAWQQAVAQLLPTADVLFDALAAQGAEVLATVLGVATGVLDVVAQVGVILILSIYWSADQVRFERLWLALLRGRTRARARSVWRDLEGRVGAVIRAQVAISALAGVLLGLGYQFLGLEQPAIVALAAALVRLVPWLGPVLAVAAPYLASLTDVPLGTAAAAYTIIVLLALDRLLRPRLLAGRRTSALLGLLTLIVMGRGAGLIGMVLAPAVAAAIAVIPRYLTEPSPARAIQRMRRIDALRGRAEVVRSRLEETAEPQAATLRDAVERLERLIEQAQACCLPQGDGEP